MGWVGKKYSVSKEFALTPLEFLNNKRLVLIKNAQVKDKIVKRKFFILKTLKYI